MPQPYLTIVLTSRNDDYSGGALPRLQICVDSLLERALQYQLELELILVDWNPPEDKAPLKDSVDWSMTNDYSTIRVIEVPPSIHQQLRFSDKLPFFPHTARNVGARRARGKFVLVTATDILFSESIFAYLASKQLSEEKNYRVTRYDVPDQVIKIDTLRQKLVFCEKNIRYIHRQPQEGIFGLPRLHTYASGDFVLLSKDNYFKLHGIPEEKEFNGVHFDTVFCYMMYARNIQEEFLDEPHRIYHMDHESFWNPSPSWAQQFIQTIPYLRPKLRNQLKWVAQKLFGTQSPLDRSGVPYITQNGHRLLRRTLTDLVNKKEPIVYNDAFWGLGNHTLSDTEIVHAKYAAPTQKSKQLVDAVS